MAITEKLRAVYRVLRLLLAVLLLVFIVLFMIQNAEAIQLKFLFWSFTARRSLVVILLLVAGAGLGLLLRGYVRLKWNRSVRAAAQRAVAEEKDRGAS